MTGAKYRIWGNFRMSNFRITAKGTFRTVLFSNFRHDHQVRTALSFDALKNVLYRVMVRGYRMYPRVWESSVGEKLTCQRERGNLIDAFNHAGNFRTGFIFV